MYNNCNAGVCMHTKQTKNHGSVNWHGKPLNKSCGCELVFAGISGKFNKASAR